MVALSGGRQRSRPAVRLGEDLMRFGVGLFSLQCTAMQPSHWAGAYREMREHAVLMEELGYDELWLSEHHFFYDGYCPALLPAAASVLSVTERLRVGTGMLLLPMQDPHRLAAVAQDLSARSGGRLDVGVGLGYRDIEFDGHGISRKQRLPRMLKGLEVLEAAEKAGGPPIWMGAQLIDPVRRAGERGHPLLFSGALPFERCKTLAKVWEEGWLASGRPAADKPSLGALRNIWMSEDPDERAAGRDWVRASYVQYAGLGWTLPAVGEHEQADFAEETDKAIADTVETTITGSAEDCIEQLSQFESIGIHHIAFRLMLDGMPRAALESQLRRLAREVLPHLKDRVAA
jgi:alkanesulfonate monooxygenase SsuD/methylene tetrahydromethanopterin reductase-like flavin-dependent oxidoreductase (luciferase family)